jgi:hypothetical protein
MIGCRGILGGIATLLALAGAAPAEDREPAAVVELGGSGELGLQDGSSSFGPSAAVEFTPIKNWLEIEGGVSPLFGGGRTEWGTDLLFKKPFDLSDGVEFMFGAGPEWKHTIGGGATTDSIVGEAVLDFMFWPSKERTVGWFFEPTYGYDFGRGHEQSLGATVGLLIAIR